MSMITEPVTVKTAAGNRLLAEFELGMATLWDCPEVKPLPNVPHNLCKIFDRLLRMCEDGMPDPISLPEDGELSVEWEGTRNRFVFLHIDVVTLKASVGVADLNTMKTESEEITLRGESDWRKVEAELRNVGYRR